MFSERNDVTLPTQGWPWPWNDSNTTDYAYAFEEGQVWAIGFGYLPWFEADGEEPELDDSGSKADFPDMSAVQNVTLGKRSGVMIVGKIRPEG